MTLNLLVTIEVVFAVELLLAKSLETLGFGNNQSSLVSIEDFGEFFQSATFGFDVELPDDEKFNDQPDAVYKIVLPANSVQSDRVDVRVEEKSKVDTKTLDSHTLGTDGEGHDFDNVGNGKRSPGSVIGGIEQEDHSNGGGTSR